MRIDEELMEIWLNEVCDKVTTFVDDVLVGTETEEGHDETVKEVLRRLEENDLYYKTLAKAT